MNLKIVHCFLLALSVSFSGYGQTGLNFDGVDDYISSNTAGVAGSGERTIEAWIRTTASSIPGQGGQRVIANYGNMTLGTRYTFCLLWNNALRIEIGGAGFSGNTPVNDGIWHHVAATYKSGTVSLYVDGVLDSSGSMGSTVNTAVNNFVIGERIDGVNQFEGDLDELRFWNIALNPAQLAVHDSSEICSPIPNLLAYYKFNDGIANGNNSTVTTLIDDALSGNNANLFNFGLNGGGSNFIASPVLGGGLNLALTVNSCGPYTAINGLTYAFAGQYNDTILDPNGCDTILSLNLSITNIDNTVVRSGPSQLEANESDTAASYRWLDCQNNYTPISGAVGRSFNFLQNGSYAVEVSLNACVDTSACFIVTNVGLVQFVNSEFELYPNPSDGTISIKFTPGTYNTFELMDSQGQLIEKGDLDLNGNNIMAFKNLQGIYTLVLVGDHFRKRKKVLFKKH